MHPRNVFLKCICNLHIVMIKVGIHFYSNLYFEPRVSFPLSRVGRAVEDGALALLGSSAPKDATDSHRHPDRLP